MKGKIIALAQMLINIALVPLYFIPFFHEVGVFPGEDANGNFITDRRDFYYSAYQNLSGTEYESLIYLHFALIAAAILVAGLRLVFQNNQKMRYISDGLSICSVLIFCCLFALASTVYRAY